MNKTTIILISLSIIFILVLGFVVWDLYIKDKTSDNTNIKPNNKEANQKGSNQNKSNNMPPTAAIEACKSKAIGDSCQFSDKEGTLSGTCNDDPGVLACAPNREGNNQPNTNNKQDNQNTNTTPVMVSADFNSCINNTKDNPACKDCCDCLSGVTGETRTSCRDTCAVHDFTKNSNFITVTAPSTLGPNGDYSECTAKASSGECKVCCEGTMGLQCGDYRHCRTGCNTKFGTTSGPAA